MPTVLLESTWKKLLKDNPSVDDPGLADALKKYAKSAGKEVDERLEVLEELVALAEQARKQTAKSKIKDVTDHLDEVIAEAKQETSKLENEDEGATGALEDENAYGVYLKKTLRKLLKKPMFFAAGLGRSPVDHKIIFHKSQEGKKLLKTLRDATSLKKFVWGLAAGHADEATTMTLALESPQVGGLKKKLEQLLKHFKPLPFDTVLMTVDGEVVEDLVDPDDLAAGDAPNPRVAKLEATLTSLTTLVEASILAQPERAQTLRMAVDRIRTLITDEQLVQAQTELLALGKLLQVKPQSDAGGSTGAEDSAEVQCREAKSAVYPRVKDAVAANPDQKGAIIQLLAAADKEQKARNFEEALRLYQELSELVDQALQPRSETVASQSTDEQTELKEVPLVVFQQIRLAWDAARKRLQAELDTLVRAIESTVQQNNDDPDAEEIVEGAELQKGLQKIRGVLERLDTRLIDKMDEALNAADADSRRKKHREAKKIVDEYMAYVGSNEVMSSIDNNGFAPTKARATVEGALRTLSSKL